MGVGKDTNRLPSPPSHKGVRRARQSPLYVRLKVPVPLPTKPKSAQSENNVESYHQKVKNKKNHINYHHKNHQN